MISGNKQQNNIAKLENLPSPLNKEWVNPLTPRVKPWVIQCFLTFDFMDRTLECDYSLESC